jgi:hypothetical protein
MIRPVIILLLAMNSASLWNAQQSTPLGRRPSACLKYRDIGALALLRIKGGSGKKDWGTLRIPESVQRKGEDEPMSSFDSMDNVVLSSEEMVLPADHGMLEKKSLNLGDAALAQPRINA